MGLFVSDGIYISAHWTVTLEISKRSERQWKLPLKASNIAANILKWAISWDYGTFRPPQYHSSNAHAQLSSRARCLMFGRTLRLLPYFMCANSEGSGETALMRGLAWAFVVRLCDKYHNLMSWLKYHNCKFSENHLLNSLTSSYPSRCFAKTAT